MNFFNIYSVITENKMMQLKRFMTWIYDKKFICHMSIAIDQCPYLKNKYFNTTKMVKHILLICATGEKIFDVIVGFKHSVNIKVDALSSLI